MEPNDASSTTARAQELRASLTARQEAEELLAEAGATRRAAARAADALVAEAQQLSEALVAESRVEADRTGLEARERAEALLQRAREEGEEITRQARAAAESVRARAEAQVEDYRRRVRAEVTEQVTREIEEATRETFALVHERQQSMIGDLEASVRILGVALEGATANVGEMLGSLEDLRVHTAESLGEPTVPTAPTEPTAPGDQRVATGAPPGARDHLFRSTAGEVAEAGPDATPGAAVPGGRSPWNGVDAFGQRASSASASPAPQAARATSPERAEQEAAELEELTRRIDGDEDPPMTATEAFLLSAGVDHGDPPLPPSDQGEVGARYARDAMRATARARTRQDDDGLDVPERRPAADGTSRDEAARADRPDRTDQTDRSEDAEPREGQGDPSGRPLGWLFRSS